MVAAYAIHGVHTLEKAGAVNGDGKVTARAKVKARVPGDVFEIDDVTFAELLAEGAIRPPTREEMTLAEESGKFKKAAPPLVDYASKSEDDLKKIAASKSVDVSKAKNKQDLIDALRASDAAKVA